MYYIPGNHDAEILFRPDDESREGMQNHHINTHGKVLEIRSGLLLASFGGSTLTFFKENGHVEENECWNPYPWNTEPKYKAVLETFWNDKV